MNNSFHVKVIAALTNQSVSVDKSSSPQRHSDLVPAAEMVALYQGRAGWIFYVSTSADWEASCKKIDVSDLLPPPPLSRDKLFKVISCSIYNLIIFKRSEGCE